MASQDRVVFSHPMMSTSLSVSVNPNQIEWSYGLNTANYPTYGGEVIQILSCYVDDMAIQGNVGTYAELEKIYNWFITYIQIATTGVTGSGKFNIDPVSMYYKARGWAFTIYPTGLPGFRYGRDVVSPEWMLSASVVDPAQDLQTAIIDDVTMKAINSEDGVQLFGKATADIGFSTSNPFSDPDAGLTKANKDKFIGGASVNNDVSKLADQFNKLIPSYLNGDFTDLTSDYSKPVLPSGVNKGTVDAKKTVTKGKAGKK